MTYDELSKYVLNIKRWSRGDQRAPNKPLLMTYILSQYLHGHSQLFSFLEIEQPVRELLIQFGPVRKAYHPEYPFWRLVNDGFWRIDNAEHCLPRKSNTDPPKSELVKHSVLAGFNDEAYALLSSSPKFILELLENVLLENFPESMVPDIAEHLGVELSWVVNIKRDPNFRREVLRAYNYQCAICGYDLRLDDASFGLEAAHIKWKTFHGPCDVNNGLSLCSIHHKAFDKGAISLTDDFKLRVSSRLNGGTIAERLFWEFEHQPIFLPRSTSQVPLHRFLEWHNKEVFHG